MEQKVLHYNRKAIHHLNRGEYLTSLEYLNKAKSKMRGSSLTNCSKLMGITLNNLGCYYKSLNEPEKALAYLGQALEVNKVNISDLNNLAATHLNLAVTESQLGNHLSALDNCLKVVHMLRSVYSSNPTLAQTFISAHFNASVEYSSLGRLEESRAILELGSKYSKELLGCTHFLTQKIENAISSLPSVKNWAFNGKSSPPRENPSPFRSIRTSTAATSGKKKLRSEHDRSTDTYNSTFSRLSKRFASPNNFRKTLQGLSPIKLGTCKTTKITFSKLKPRRNRTKKKVVTRSEVGVQVSSRDPKSEAAVKIQRAWKRFKIRKAEKARNIDLYIQDAESKVQVAYNELKKLQSLKAKIQNREILDIREFKPIPYRAKYFCEANSSH